MGETSSSATGWRDGGQSSALKEELLPLTGSKERREKGGHSCLKIVAGPRKLDDPYSLCPVEEPEC